MRRCSKLARGKIRGRYPRSRDPSGGQRVRNPDTTACDSCCRIAESPRYRNLIDITARDAGALTFEFPSRLYSITINPTPRRTAFADGRTVSPCFKAPIGAGASRCAIEHPSHTTAACASFTKHAILVDDVPDACMGIAIELEITA